MTDTVDPILEDIIMTDTVDPIVEEATVTALVYRKAKHISDGRIDCEIEHPMHGWIPYTLDPADTDTTVDNDELLAAMTEADDVEAYIPPTPPTAEEELATEREGMSCTRQQGKIALGEAAWLSLVAISEAPDMPWGLRVAIEDTTVWRRTNGDMQALIWAMNLTETEADDLFRLAATL